MPDKTGVGGCYVEERFSEILLYYVILDRNVELRTFRVYLEGTVLY